MYNMLLFVLIEDYTQDGFSKIEINGILKNLYLIQINDDKLTDFLKLNLFSTPKDDAEQKENLYNFILYINYFVLY